MVLDVSKSWPYTLLCNEYNSNSNQSPYQDLGRTTP
jgi:hypothetical protein